MTTSAQFQKRLGQILLALGFINEEQLARLQSENAKHAGEKYGETAIRLKFVTSEQVAAILDVQVLQGRLGAILTALGYVTKEQRDTLLAKGLQEGEKIGDAAVRTGLIDTKQLDRALDVQEIIQRKLGQILLALGFITQEQHTRIVEENKQRQGERFGETAVALGYVNEEQVVNSVEIQQLDGRLGSILVALGDISREQRDQVIRVSKQHKGGLFGEIALWLGFINPRQLNRAVKVQRRLQLETLEVRQMMSVNPFGVDNLDNNTDEYEVAPPAYYASQTPGTAGNNEDYAEKVADPFNILGLGDLDDLDDHDEHGDLHDHDEFPVVDEQLAAQFEADQQNAGTATQSFETALTPTSFDLNDTFKLHSKADSHLTIYIDFTGYTCKDSFWTSSNGGKDIVAPAWSLDADHSSFSDAELKQIYNIWQRVAEDYAPFDVDVTTEKPADDRLARTSTTDTDYGIHVVVDDNSTDWYGNAGGVAGVGTFTATTDRVAWVFSKQLQNSEKYMAEAISHEAGHTLGLNHDGTASTAYYQGANGWAPIMGTGYYQAVTQWSKGEYSNANNKEDDLAVINRRLAYREDDHGDTFATASKVDTANGTFKSFGIIEKNTDVDIFQFTLDKAWTLDINIKSGMRDANLDILAKLCAADGTVIAVSDSPDTMDAVFKQNLGPGNYYITIEGTGKVVDGKVIYTDYGSLGTYTVTGNLKENTPPTAPAGLKATSTDRTVSLSWAQQDNVTGYTLQYRPAGSNAGWTTVAVAANASSAKVSGLDAETTYEFQLTATNAFGTATAVLTAVTNAPGDYSNAAGLTLTAKSGMMVTMQWDAVDGAKSYTLQASADGGQTWSNWYTGTNTTFSKTPAKAGTDYLIRVSATTASGTTEFSDPVAFNSSDPDFVGTPVKPTITVPTAPVVNVVDRTTDTVTLNWNAQSGVASYTLQYRVAGSNEWVTAESPAGNAVGATVSGLKDGTNYEFQLTATNAVGTATAVLAATTDTATPVTPPGDNSNAAGLTLTAKSG
ncbi:MAG: fibronectin type III domain-containing protein, partial [Planctomycetaceae bacterium]|nr:fibronectin type III domain-containing protein [Planctomycetaceae bacterium]